MIKKILTSKLATTASAETTIMGLKMQETEAHALRILGIALCLVSAAILYYSWRTEASHTIETTSHKHNQRRSRTASKVTK